MIKKFTLGFLLFGCFALLAFGAAPLTTIDTNGNVDTTGEYLTNGASLAIGGGSGGGTNEIDPVWTSASNLYYLKTQADSLFATGSPLYGFTEADPIWSSSSNLYYLKTQADALFATGSPLYGFTETDPAFTAENTLAELNARIADATLATGTPIYAESDPQTTNELNQALSIVTNQLRLTDQGGTLTADLSPYAGGAGGTTSQVYQFTADGSNVFPLVFNNTISTGRYNLIAGGDGGEISGSSGAGGADGNTISGGVDGRITGNKNSTIGGGDANTVESTTSTVEEGNTISGGNNGLILNAKRSTIGGGNNHYVSQDDSTIAGGNANDARTQNSTVGGGEGNEIWQSISASTIGGGRINAIARRNVGFFTRSDTSQNDPANSGSGMEGATIGGGLNNDADGFGTTISGGAINFNASSYATIPGGTHITIADGSDYSVGIGGRNVFVMSNALYSVALGQNIVIPAGFSNTWVFGRPNLEETRAAVRILSPFFSPQAVMADSLGGMTADEYAGKVMAYDDGGGFGVGVVLSNDTTNVYWEADTSMRSEANVNTSFNYGIYDTTALPTGDDQLLFAGLSVGVNVTNGPEERLHVGGNIKGERFVFPLGDYLTGDGTNLFYVNMANTTNQITSN